MEGISTLKDAVELLGINHLAARHMIEFSMINETKILKDLENGLLFEWLTFIDTYTDSNCNNFKEEIIKLQCTTSLT